MEVLWKREEMHEDTVVEADAGGAQFVIDDEDDEETIQGPLKTPTSGTTKPKTTMPSVTERLFSCLIDLLFCCGFTLPRKLQVDHHKINYVIWYISMNLLRNAV